MSNLQLIENGQAQQNDTAEVEALKVSPYESLNLSPEDLTNIARLYVEGYGEAPWGEKHDPQVVSKRMADYVIDGSHHFYVDRSQEGDKLRGFGITHVVPTSRCTELLSEEMSAVSGVSMSEADMRAIERFISEHPITSEPEFDIRTSTVGVVQDFVITPEFRGTTTYFEILLRMIKDLCESKQTDFFFVYTHKDIKAVVYTLSKLFEGKIVYSSDAGILLFAESTRHVIEHLPALLKLISK